MSAPILMPEQIAAIRSRLERLPQTSTREEALWVADSHEALRTDALKLHGLWDECCKERDEYRRHAEALAAALAARVPVKEHHDRCNISVGKVADGCDCYARRHADANAAIAAFRQYQEGRP